MEGGGAAGRVLISEEEEPPETARLVLRTSFVPERAGSDKMASPRGTGRLDRPPLPKLVLFDLDDTIFDHSLTCRGALGKLRQEHAVLRGGTLDEAWHEYGRLLGITHPDVMLGRRTSDDARVERFRRLAGWSGHSVDQDTAASLSRTYRDYYQQLRRPVPGAPELLHRLQGRAKIGVVTNNTVTEQEEKLEFLGLEPVVDYLVTSEEVGAAKPNPAIFRAALERAGVTSGEAVMVGDSWTSDILGAANAGIRAVWFNRFRVARPTGFDVPEFATFRTPRRVERLLATPLRPSAAS